jgi:protein-disulfide isomerase
MNAPASVPPLADSDHVLGHRGARVTIIEYGDFECPNCKQAESMVKRLLERHSDDICLAFRHFPLVGVHAYAMLAAQAVEVAADQGRFWEMHDLLFEHQDLLDLPHLRSFATKVGLDPEEFATELDSGRYLDRVDSQVSGATLCGVRATPTFFVNGELLDVSFGLGRLYERVEALLR